VSDTGSRGWDGPTDPADPLPLCDYHATTTERLSTHHSNQIARQAPCCIALKAS
jgi:hypothetical protein